MRPVFLLFFTLVLACTGSQALEVDGARLNATLEHMKTFGAAPGGGSDRTAFTEANRAALAYVAAELQSFGFTSHIDVAGNLVARHEGREAGLAPLLTGSHLDTVPNGGHYDGIVGVLGAVEVGKTLQGQALRHPLEIIVWANEEGGKTGSRSIYGAVGAEELDLPALGGIAIGEGTAFLGGDPTRLAANERAAGEIAAYVELHIEQGAELDRKGLDIGVVEGIVGIRRWYVDVLGQTNHAGTTPMDQRYDAVLAAAEFVTAVNDVITGQAGRQVGTVGMFEAVPGAPNVIAGEARLSLEIRDLSMERIDQLFGAIRTRAADIEKARGVRLAFRPYYTSPAALASPAIQRVIAAETEALGYRYQSMPSGAGHDAQSIAQRAPMGMIFVPSRDGISHAPQEYTSPEQITRGANVLLKTLLRLDRELD